jgi:hypothetical protein
VGFVVGFAVAGAVVAAVLGAVVSSMVLPPHAVNRHTVRTKQSARIAIFFIGQPPVISDYNVSIAL